MTYDLSIVFGRNVDAFEIRELKTDTDFYRDVHYNSTKRNQKYGNDKLEHRKKRRRYGDQWHQKCRFSWLERYARDRPRCDEQRAEYGFQHLG